MLRRFLLIFAVFLAGCATPGRVPIDYTGTDAGTVVIGMGATAGTYYSSYSLLFRKRRSPGSAEDHAVSSFTYFQTNMFYKQAPDFQSAREMGVVLIHSLPPGDYEICNFDIFFNGGTVQSHFGSKVDVSIPFSVKPGETSYLGNYQANGLSGKNFLGMSFPAGAVFVVTSRLKDELSAAQLKSNRTLGTTTDATPDPNRLANPFFRGPLEGIAAR